MEEIRQELERKNEEMNRIEAGFMTAKNSYE